MFFIGGEFGVRLLFQYGDLLTRRVQRRMTAQFIDQRHAEGFKSGIFFNAFPSRERVEEIPFRGTEPETQQARRCDLGILADVRNDLAEQGLIAKTLSVEEGLGNMADQGGLEHQ